MKCNSFNRLLSMMVAVFMVFSFVACGKSKESVAEKTQPTASAQSATDEKVFDPNAKYDPAITIKYGYALNKDFKFRDGETAEKNPWAELYAENGINLELMWNVDDAQNDTKMKTAIASGDYPDVFLAQPQDYVEWAKSGVISDITDLFDKYINDHGKEYFNADGGTGLQSAKVDGRMYGLPSIGNPYDGAMLLWVRSDWLKNLNLEAPKTVDELIKVAEAFTKNDPDKNNKNDTYGLALNGKEVLHYYAGIQPFFESFGAYPGSWSGTYTFVKDGDNLVWGGALPGMKEGLKKLQEMYKAGYIAKDFGLKDNGKVQEDVISGKVGMYYAPMWGHNGDLIKKVDGADQIAVPIPGLDSSAYGKTYLNSATGGYWCVSSKCKNPEVLFKIFNLSLEKLAYTKDEAEFDKYVGKDGIAEFKLALCRALSPLKNYDNYKKVTAAIKSKDSSQLNVEQKSNYTSIMKYLDSPKFDRTKEEQTSGWWLYKVFGAPDGGYAALDTLIKSNNFMPSVYNAPNTELMASKFATLDKMAKEEIIKIIYGNSSVDEYDKFLENWKKLGGDDITKEANDWYAKNGK